MAGKDKKVGEATSRHGRIMTLSDLNPSSSDCCSGCDCDSDSDSPQEYYVGGQRSGMLVQGPPKRDNDNDNVNVIGMDLGGISDGAGRGGAVEIQAGPFEGVGRTLGSRSSTSPHAATSSSTVQRGWQGYSVDKSQPCTSIQIRLADGTRVVATFNHNHTIADIRGFIDEATPPEARRGGDGITYQIQAMGFPPRTLNDGTQTIEKAGLLNSVVLQKF